MIHRDGLQMLLEARPGFEVVGSAKDCGEAIGKLRGRSADVVLLDLPTVGVPRIEDLQALAATSAPARIIVLGSALDRSQIVEALCIGVRGIVLENDNAEKLSRSIEVVAAGQYWIEGSLAADLAQDLHARGPSPAPYQGPLGRLTAREREIVQILAGGGTNKEIARACRISEKTVKHHLTNIFNKIGVSNRLELAVFALEHPQLLASDRQPARPPGVGS